MLLKLRDRYETPPGYWRFPRDTSKPATQESDFIFGGDLDNLVSKVHAYRIANRLPLGNPQEEIEDWICRNSGAQCRPASPATPLPGRKARGSDVARFMSAMAAWLVSSEKVTQEEADRRAEICSNCQFNAPVDDTSCWGCYALASRIFSVIGNRKTRVDESLKNCNLCGCVNAVAVFAPMEVLAKTHRLEDFPVDIGTGVKCWKREYFDSLQK